MLRYRSWFKPR